jgi:excisionase family DNA binding protein
MHDLLSIDEAAQMLHISRTKAYQWASTDMPGVIRIGRSVRVSRRRLEEWIDAATAADAIEQRRG